MQDGRNPDISPLYANLMGMPPALFTIGTLDPVLDDSLFMYTSRAELQVYPGGAHGFIAFPCAIAHTASERMCAFLASVGR